MDLKAGIYTALGVGVTGSTDLVIKIKRDADNYFYDFNDNIFKASGWTTIAGIMTEVDAINIPGEYEYAIDISGWPIGFYTIYTQYSGSPAWTDINEFQRTPYGILQVSTSDVIFGR